MLSLFYRLAVPEAPPHILVCAYFFRLQKKKKRYKPERFVLLCGDNLTYARIMAAFFVYSRLVSQYPFAVTAGGVKYYLAYDQAGICPMPVKSLDEF